MISVNRPGPRNRRWASVLFVVALGLVTAACEAADDTDDIGADDTDEVEEVVDSSDIATDDSAADDEVEELTPTLEPEPTATPEPEPTETPEPEPVAATEARAPPSGEMTIYHFDVGQADATLIDAPDVTILIDAGDWQRDDVVGHIHSVGVDSIDLFILTHPHADHIGQVPQVMNSFSVGEVWMSGWEHDTQTFERALDAVLNSDAGYHEPRAGETESYGDITIEVIHPVDPLADIHDNIGVRITYGEFAAVYTGDAEAQHETEMINRGHELSATLLQLGHHGSNTSTTGSFLDAVSPEVAIYSAAEDSQYGHPHAEVVERVQGAGIELYGTAVHGTIAITTDGDTYTVQTDFEGDVVAPAPEPEATDDHEEEHDDPAPAAVDGCVDINSASFEELQEIVNIGPDRAEEIIALRPFASVDAMDRISGIGPARLDEIKEQGLACVP